MAKFFQAVCFALILTVCVPVGADETVTATGKAAGSGKIARQQAMADALREAVRKGAGVNIISTTQVTDYVLDFDRVFSRAFGYVKNFKVLSSGYDGAGLYYVKISALVGEGTPGLDDYLAMRQIIAMKGSPRLLIRVSGRLAGIGDAEKLIDGQLREIALKCGFQTIRVSQFNEAEAKRGKRDKLLGRNRSSSYREAGIRDNYDFVIDAEISGACNGKSEVYGIATRRFSLGADLGAAYPNGNAIAQVTIPGREIDIARVSDENQAARSALQKVLGDESGRNFRALLMRVLASWVAEFDSGAKITVEFPEISRDLFDEVVRGLREAKGVNSVYVREFDDQLKSVIEVESNLKAYDLAGMISSLAGNRLKTEHTTSDYIQMFVTYGYGTMDMIIIIGGTLVAIALLVLIIKNLRHGKAANKS